MANSPDPVQPQLKPLGWKSAGGWRGFEHRMFQLTPPPRDFTPWTNPGGMMGPVSIRTEVNQSGDCQRTCCAALDFLSKYSAEVWRNAITFEVCGGPTVALGTDCSHEKYLTISFYDADRRHVAPPSAELLRPWVGSATCEYGVNPAERTTKLSSWTIDDLRSRLAELPLYSLRLGGISSEQFARACEAVKQEVAGKDLDIDIVHRPQGDCYFDIQALSFNPADDTVVRTTLAEAIALLDVKAEIWDGDPFLRWQ